MENNFQARNFGKYSIDFEKKMLVIKEEKKQGLQYP